MRFSKKKKKTQCIVLAFGGLLEWTLSATSPSNTVHGVSPMNSVLLGSETCQQDGFVLSLCFVELCNEACTDLSSWVIWIPLVRAKPPSLGFLIYQRRIEVIPPLTDV